MKPISADRELTLNTSILWFMIFLCGVKSESDMWWARYEKERERDSVCERER